MKTIDFGRQTYQVAEEWKELTPEQFKQLIMCPRLQADGSYETLDNEAAACRVWLGMSQAKWAKLVLSHWQWGQLRQQFSWLFSTRPVGKPPIDVFAHKGVNYHLPAPDFGDTSAIEVAFSNMAFTDFAHPDEPAPEALDRLIATLCRPRRKDWRKFQKSKDWNGDVREEFTEQRMSDRAKALADLDIQTKLVVLDYFERMNNEFLSQYGELFGGKKEPRYGDGRGWVMLIKNVAKEGHFGDFDKVCSTPAHLLFATLLDDLLDNQERAEQTKQAHENN
ncbi:hypothetical protein GCM10028819_33480 [Spirosoma humi]